jgi:hypothetical protein
MTVTDGQFSTLSGQVFDNAKLINGLPSKSDFKQLSQTHSSRFNSIESDIATIQSSLDGIIGYMQNLKLAHSSLYSDFTGHTGLYVYDFSGSGTSGAHNG